MRNFNKLVAILGNDTVTEMEAMSESELKGLIYCANNAMREEKDKLDDNDAYQEIKLKKSALEQGKREVDKRQRAKIEICLRMLEEKG